LSFCGLQTRTVDTENHTHNKSGSKAETRSNWSLITESLFNETHHEPEVRQD